MSSIDASATTAFPAAARSRSVLLTSGQWVRMHALTLLIAALAVLGTVLRVAAARGDLWLDEVWSLHLVAPLTSPDQVFWAISHDNNHFLNSLWIYFVGQNGSPILYRLPSILFGATSILVAAHIGRRVNSAAAIVAALLVAVSYTCVDYGSEARGYGALILALLVAVDLLSALIVPASAEEQTAWSCRTDRRLRWALGITIALGACAHLTMVIGATLLGLSLLCMLKPGRTVPQVLDAAVEVFRPALLLLLPLAGAIVAGVVVQGGFTLGGASPFSVEHFLEGYGGLITALLGLPSIIPPWAGLAAAAFLVVGLCALGLVGPRSRVLAAVALLAIPAITAVARPSNVEFPRYFLAPGLFFLLTLAEAAGRAWGRGGFLRFAAAAIVGAICLGQAPRVAELLRDHRGSSAAAVRLMAAEGPATFQGSRPTALVADYYSKQLNLPVTAAARPIDCRAPATWLILDSGNDEAVPDLPELEHPTCHTRYLKAASFPTALWSGRAWALYRQER